MLLRLLGNESDFYFLLPNERLSLPLSLTYQGHHTLGWKLSQLSRVVVVVMSQSTQQANVQTSKQASKQKKPTQKLLIRTVSSQLFSDASNWALIGSVRCNCSSFNASCGHLARGFFSTGKSPAVSGREGRWREQQKRHCWSQQKKTITHWHSRTHTHTSELGDSRISRSKNYQHQQKKQGYCSPVPTPSSSSPHHRHRRTWTSGVQQRRNKQKAPRWATRKTQPGILVGT